MSNTNHIEVSIRSVWVNFSLPSFFNRYISTTRLLGLRANFFKFTTYSEREYVSNILDVYNRSRARLLSASRTVLDALWLFFTPKSILFNWHQDTIEVQWADICGCNVFNIFNSVVDHPVEFNRSHVELNVKRFGSGKRLSAFPNTYSCHMVVILSPDIAQPVLF